MTTIRKNERSWAIELISQINQFTTDNDLIIKRAGGEATVSEHKGQNMFPDVILFGDHDSSSILQGWELKMPDVPINDADFVHDAQRKATALNLNSCVIWNFTHVRLYVFDDNRQEFTERKKWDNNSIKTRDDVQRYKSKWEQTLQSVLTTVNDYLISGQVKKTFIGDVLATTSISRLVSENKFSVAAHLREMANRDAIMEARLETWWKEIKFEYEGDEEDKYPAYAKSVIINWANRIIFAHLIKHRQMSAYAIDELDYDITPEEGNTIFKLITEKSDFYNIFASMPYNDCLPEKTWASLVELSLFLKSTPIKDISQRILQQVLEGSVNISKRLVNGQYPTPPVLASILSRMTIHDVTGECFDGCCGTGTIPSFIIDYKKSKHIGSEKSMATTWASDKFKLPLQIANLAMTSYDTINMPCRLFQKDILTLHSGDEVEIVNPQTGVKETYMLPLFDSFISNLPFVKSRDIPKDDKAYTDIIKDAHQLSGRSDYSYYIALHIHSMIKEGGYVGIILSNSFLGSEAGYKFLHTVRELFDDIRIHISGSGRWFSNAEIVTALLVMRKRRQDDYRPGISFFKWQRNLDIISENRNYQDAIVNSSLLDQEIDGEVVTRVHYEDDSIVRLITLGISYNSMFIDQHWLLEIGHVLTPMNQVLSIIRGSRRGWDEMFYPSDDSGIEPEFLKDVLMNARSTDYYVAKPDRKAFCCSLSIEELEDGGYNGALAWIRRFEHETNEKDKPLPKILARRDMHWYELKTDEIADICTMMNPDNRMFYAKFETPTFVNQRLIGLRRKKKEDDLDLMLALLNTTLSIFFIEAAGFGRGQCVLDFNKDSLSQCSMLNPALLTEKQVVDIKEKFSTLMARGIVDVEQDLQDPIRQDFDMTVLKAYGIEKYYDIIVNNLKSMRHIRKTVKQNILMQVRMPKNENNELQYETYLDKAAESGVEN